MVCWVNHPWRWLLGFNTCPSILDDDYCDLIPAQASLMIIIGISFMSKRPWWILKFDPCPSILDYVDWDFINVQASIMMTIVILSMLKHPTWWLLWFDPCPSILDGDYCKFNPCPSILDDIDWDFINVQAYLMMMGVWSKAAIVRA